MIPPGVFRGLAGAHRWPDQVALWKSQRSNRCQRSGLRCATRDYSAEVSSCVSAHEIARRVGMARSTVWETLKRTETTGLSRPLPDDMSDGALEAALYANRRSKRGHRRVAEPGWASVHRELKRKYVKGLAHADWLALLLDKETSWRRDKRLTARLHAAKLRQQGQR